MQAFHLCLALGLVVGLTLPCAAQSPVSQDARGQTETAPADTVDPQQERVIYDLIEQYRLGYQMADPTVLAEIFADFTPAVGQALSTYHQTAKNLAVKVDDVRILKINSREAVAAFIREDSFIDAQSGKPVHLQVKLTKRFVHQGGLWRMLAAAQPH